MKYNNTLGNRLTSTTFLFQLCYANVEGDTAMVPLGKDGPIYSFEWAPNLKPVMFAVVYGYMPAKATLYNKKCEAVFDFGTGPR